MVKKNIAFMVHDLNSGGIENYLLRYLLNEHKKFKKIFIYCKSGKGGQLENEYLSIPNIVIVKRRISYWNIWDFINFRCFLKSLTISIVCDFTGNFSGPILFIATTANVTKRVAFYRSSSDRFKKDFIRTAYNNFSNYLVRKCATDILSNSNAGFSYFFNSEWINDSRFELVRNGINAFPILNETEDLRSELNIPKNSFVVGHTGRFNDSKNHATIISVAEILIDKYDDIYFIMCGNGVKKNLQNEVVDKELSNRIFLFENRRDISKILNTLNCFIFPSITEGQPNSLIEALISGVNCVTSNIISIKETVPISHTNHFDPYDVKSFADAIVKLYKEGSVENVSVQKEMIERFDHRKAFSKLTSKLI